MSKRARAYRRYRLCRVDVAGLYVEALQQRKPGCEVALTADASNGATCQSLRKKLNGLVMLNTRAAQPKPGNAEHSSSTTKTTLSGSETDGRLTTCTTRNVTWQSLLMNTVDEIPIAERQACADCIREAYMTDLISRTGASSPCHYCASDGPTITLWELSEHVERAIAQHFDRTSTEPEGYEYYLHKETGGWERSGDPVAQVITEILEADEAIADDVREVLDAKTSDWESAALGEEQPFDDETHYEAKSAVDHSSISEAYHQFETMVIEQARYFSPDSRDLLHSLFGQLEGLRTRGGRPVLVEAMPEAPESCFFRARVFQDEALLKRALVNRPGFSGGCFH